MATAGRIHETQLIMDIISYNTLKPPIYQSSKQAMISSCITLVTKNTTAQTNNKMLDKSFEEGSCLTNLAPQCLQNKALSSFSWKHLWHNIISSPCVFESALTNDF